MSYILNPIDKFGAKDTLPEDHPEKKILGVEFDEEFIKISASIMRLEQNLDPDGDGLYGFVPEAPISTELQGRYNNGVTIEWRAIPQNEGGMTDQERAKLEEAHGWGNHADAGYIKDGDTLSCGTYETTINGGSYRTTIAERI